MKRIIAAALILALCILLCSCGQEAQPLSRVFADMKDQVGLSDLVEFHDASGLDRFYGISAEDVAEFAGGINNTGVIQEEIVLIRATDADAAARIAEKLTNRLNSKLNETKNYNPEQYAIIEKCGVETNGNYVSLIISENADKLKPIYHSGIGA